MKTNRSIWNECLGNDGQAIPHVVSQIDSSERTNWTLWVPYVGKNAEDLAEIHGMLRRQGITRFCQEGQLQIFPEDREYPKAE